MAIIPAGAVNQTKLNTVISRAIRKLGSEAVRVNYSLGEDSTGEPALFFRIVLTDDASREERLVETTRHIRAVLSDQIKLYENWGLFPYFSFRSMSEQAKRNDPEWI